MPIGVGMKLHHLPALVLLAACTNQLPRPVETPPEPTPTPVATEMPSADTMRKLDQIAIDIAKEEMATMDLPQALAFVHDRIPAKSFGEMPMSLRYLAVWGNAKMQLSDVLVPKNETTFKRVKKDPEEAYGKRMCARGMLIQITKAEDPGTWRGQLLTSGGDIMNFHAVRSTGDLVEGDSARFCGVALSLLEYPNRAGGTSVGVETVGVFDLPENRRAP